MKKETIFVVFIIAVVFLALFIKKPLTGGVITEETEMTRIKLETTQGDIVINLYNDMPVTAGNFKKLVEEGFYDGILFHRIIDGFMIQGGDPLTKDPAKKAQWGTGGSDNILDEFTHAGGNKNLRGTISMANAGPNTGSSQFFLNLVDNNFLDSKHPVFGKIVEGMDVIDKIAKVNTDAMDRPIDEVKIIKATVL